MEDVPKTRSEGGSVGNMPLIDNWDSIGLNPHYVTTDSDKKSATVSYESVTDSEKPSLIEKLDQNLDSPAKGMLSGLAMFIRNEQEATYCKDKIEKKDDQNELVDTNLIKKVDEVKKNSIVTVKREEQEISRQNSERGENIYSKMQRNQSSLGKNQNNGLTLENSTEQNFDTKQKPQMTTEVITTAGNTALMQAGASSCY